MQAARLMLTHKGIDFDLSRVIPGLHPGQLRAAGFSSGTVPAVKIEGHKVQGTLQLSRLLDEIVPERPLFPVDAGLRAEVEGAEAWGNDVLQPMPRRLFRWSMRHNNAATEWLIKNDIGWMPAKRLNATLFKPVAAAYARMEGATDDRIRQDLIEFDAALNQIEELLERGVLGGPQRNAADFQIAPSIRVSLAAPVMAERIGDRPAAQWAREVLPDYPGEPIPLILPDDV